MFTERDGFGDIHGWELIVGARARSNPSQICPAAGRGAGMESQGEEGEDVERQGATRSLSSRRVSPSAFGNRLCLPRVSPVADPTHCSIPTARPRWLMSCSLVAFTAQASNSRLLCYRSLLAQRAAPNYSSANANACSTSSSSISAVAGGALPYQTRWSTMAADSISHFPFANRGDRCAHRSRSKVEISHRL